MKKQIIVIRGSYFKLPKLLSNAYSVGGFLIALLLCTIMASAQQPATSPLEFSQESATQFPSSSTNQNVDLTFKIIDAPNNTFGYDVFADGRLMIHQTSIPAMSGNEGFKTKEDAEKVALLVIDKIKKGEMLPTVTVEEMKELNAIK